MGGVHSATVGERMTRVVFFFWYGISQFSLGGRVLLNRTFPCGCLEFKASSQGRKTTYKLSDCAKGTPCGVGPRLRASLGRQQRDRLDHMIIIIKWGI